MSEQTEVFAALCSAVAALAEAMHSSNAVLAAAAAAALGLVALRGPLQPLLLDPSTSPAAAAVASEPTQQPLAIISAVKEAVVSDSSGSNVSGDMAVDKQPVASAGPVSESASVVTAAVQSISAATTAASAAEATPAVAPASAAVVPAAASATVVAVVAVKEQRGSLGGVVSRLVELMGDKDVKVAGRAVIAAGHMARGMPCKEVRFDSQGMGWFCIVSSSFSNKHFGIRGVCHGAGRYPWAISLPQLLLKVMSPSRQFSLCACRRNWSSLTSDSLVMCACHDKRLINCNIGWALDNFKGPSQSINVSR